MKIVAGKGGLQATYDSDGFYTDHSLVLFALKSQLTDVKSRALKFDQEEVKISEDYSLLSILAIINSSLIGWFFDVYLSSDLNIGPEDAKQLPIRRIGFVTPHNQRQSLMEEGIARLDQWNKPKLGELLDYIDERLAEQSGQADVVHDLLAYLARQMIELHKRRQKTEQHVDIFHYVDQGVPFIRLTDAFVLDESRRTDDEMDLEAVHHDIDGLRLTPDADGTWTLELQAKFRDSEQGWQAWIKEEDGYSIKRRWVPAYRLKISEEKARFYRYALPRLEDFDNARSFPGGYTRTTLEKLHLTQVPMMPDVDLSELARLDQELTETKRKIRLTDDLIDQIVYKLYGLTEEEIAIVEGRR
jgi:hypothetical protein